MTPTEFFEKGSVGTRISYGKGSGIRVHILYLSKVGEYAIGKHIGTGRRLHLLLHNGLLKSAHGCFGEVKLIE